MTTAIYVLALTLVLTAPRLAEARCAWVMWEVNAISSGGNVETAWSIAETWDAKGQCQAAARTVFERWKEKGLDVRDEALIIRQGAVQVTRGYQCLPDTIDPRGPKR